MEKSMQAIWSYQSSAWNLSMAPTVRPHFLAHSHSLGFFPPAWSLAVLLVQHYLQFLHIEARYPAQVLSQHRFHSFVHRSAFVYVSPFSTKLFLLLTTVNLQAASPRQYLILTCLSKPLLLSYSEAGWRDSDVLSLDDWMPRGVGNGKFHWGVFQPSTRQKE